MFKGYFYVINQQAYKQAKVEIEALKLSVEDYRRSFGGYPICPQNVCTPGECLFLSLAGFHNERELWKCLLTPRLFPPIYLVMI